MLSEIRGYVSDIDVGDKSKCQVLIGITTNVCWIVLSKFINWSDYQSVAVSYPRYN